MSLLTLLRGASIVGAVVWTIFLIPKWDELNKAKSLKAFDFFGLVGGALKDFQQELIIQTGVVAVLFLFGIFAGLIFGQSAEEKNNSQDNSNSSSNNSNAATETQSNTRECPQCAETIKAAAKICRYCNSPVEPILVQKLSTEQDVIKKEIITPQVPLIAATCPQCKGSITTVTEACPHCNAWLGAGSSSKPIDVTESESTSLKKVNDSTTLSNDSVEENSKKNIVNKSESKSNPLYYVVGLVIIFGVSIYWYKSKTLPPQTQSSTTNNEVDKTRLAIKKLFENSSFLPNFQYIESTQIDLVKNGWFSVKCKDTQETGISCFTNNKQVIELHWAIAGGQIGQIKIYPLDYQSKPNQQSPKATQTLTYSHGRYVGEVLDGKAHGNGSYTSAISGTVYAGQFIRDTFSGNGTMTWTNGNKFVGIWDNDVGVSGRITYPNGTTSNGMVVKGQFVPSPAQTNSQSSSQQQIQKSNFEFEKREIENLRERITKYREIYEQRQKNALDLNLKIDPDPSVKKDIYKINDLKQLRIIFEELEKIMSSSSVLTRKALDEKIKAYEKLPNLK